jgi:hypothetical protein
MVLARDTVNLPAVAPAFTDGAGCACRGLESYRATGGLGRPLCFLFAKNAVFLSHSLGFGRTGDMKARQPDFVAGFGCLNGRCQPTTKDDVFVEIECQVAWSIRDNESEINDYRKHRKVYGAQAVFMRTLKGIVVSHSYKCV